MIKFISFHSQTNVECHAFSLDAGLGRRTDITLVIFQNARLIDDLNLARFVRLWVIKYVDALLVLRFDRLVFSERRLWIADSRLLVVGVNVSLRVDIGPVKFVRRL